VKLIETKLSIGGKSHMQPCGGIRAVADLLNRVEGPMTEEILQALSTDDPELGNNIRELMFVFEDLLKISQDAMRKLLAQVDRKRGLAEDALVESRNYTALTGGHSAPDTPLAEARSLLNLGKFIEAERVMRRYLEVHKASAEGHFLLGYILFKKQDAKA